MSGQVIVLRHGQTALNKGGGTAERIRGWTDVPLDETGKKQIPQIVERLAKYKIDQVHTSPLQRAADVATPIALKAKANLHMEPALKPWNLGKLTGQRIDDKLIAEMTRYVKADGTLVPGGESFGAFRRRFLSFLVSCLGTAERTGKTLCLVTHTRDLQCACAWLAAGAPRSLAIDTKRMLDYSQELGTGQEMVIKPDVLKGAPPPKEAA